MRDLNCDHSSENQNIKCYIRQAASVFSVVSFNQHYLMLKMGGSMGVDLRLTVKSGAVYE